MNSTKQKIIEIESVAIRVVLSLYSGGSKTDCSADIGHDVVWRGIINVGFFSNKFKQLPCLKIRMVDG